MRWYPERVVYRFEMLFMVEWMSKPRSSSSPRVITGTMTDEGDINVTIVAFAQSYTWIG